MSLTDNLISYYKLDGNSNDSVGSNNGTDTSVGYVSGKIGNAGSFNGTSSFISTWPNISNSTSFSISLWVNNFSANSDYKWIVWQWVDTLGQQVWIWKHPTNKVWFSIYWDIYTSSTQITDNNFHHIVITYNTTYSKKIYIDWALDSNVTTWTTPSPWTYNFVIGRMYSTLNQEYWNWLIDEVWVWDTELSWSEITKLYNGWNWLSYP